MNKQTRLTIPAALLLAGLALLPLGCGKKDEPTAAPAQEGNFYYTGPRVKPGEQQGPSGMHSATPSKPPAGQ